MTRKGAATPKRPDSETESGRVELVENYFLGSAGGVNGALIVEKY